VVSHSLAGVDEIFYMFLLKKQLAGKQSDESFSGLEHGKHARTTWSSGLLLFVFLAALAGRAGETPRESIA